MLGSLIPCAQVFCSTYYIRQYLTVEMPESEPEQIFNIGTFPLDHFCFIEKAKFRRVLVVGLFEGLGMLTL